ncbi:unnamed protein product, partial [Discosporangium mesarthrocarpum]
MRSGKGGHGCRSRVTAVQRSIEQQSRILHTSKCLVCGQVRYCSFRLLLLQIPLFKFTLAGFFQQSTSYTDLCNRGPFIVRLWFSAPKRSMLCTVLPELIP